MDGVIGVESTLGVGSTFWFELTATIEPQFAVGSDEASVTEPPPGHTRPKRLVLYVEDNVANLKLIERLMDRRPELRLISAVTGTRGIELARVHRPEVILMDINLPDITGIEVLRLLRKDPCTAAIPVIAVSANAMQHDIEKGRQAGFFKYLTKPINVNEFTATLNLALESADLTSGRTRAT